MNYHRIQTDIRDNLFFYLIGLTFILGIKYYYSSADTDSLRWILAPTAWWAGILGGIPFEYVSPAGYVSHSFRFIIAASCSGVQFMIISTSALIFSFVHRMKTWKKKMGWTITSLAFSYLSTVLINGIRIVLAIYIPLMLQGSNHYGAWLTPERLHTIIGIAVYFSSLFILYRGADSFSWNISGQAGYSLTGTCLPPRSGEVLTQTLSRYRAPVFWYFAIVLGIPLLNRAYRSEGARFAQYALLMSAVCLAILFLVCLITVLIQHKNILSFPFCLVKRCIRLFIKKVKLPCVKRRPGDSNTYR